MFVRINKNRDNPLFDAYLDGNIVLFRKLIKEGENINCLVPNGESLFATIMTNKFGIKNPQQYFDEMIDAGVHLGIIGVEYSPLHSALLSNNQQYYIKKLLDCGADIDSWGECVCHLHLKYEESIPFIFKVPSYCDIDTLKMCLSYNPDVKPKNRNQDTILNYFMECANRIDMSEKQVCDIVEILIKAGADPNQQDSKGDSFIHKIPKRIFSKRILNLLIENNIDINSISSNGYSVLMKYVKDPVIPKIKLLIEKGADVNFAFNLRMETAAHIAANNGDYHIIQILKNNSADLSLKDYMGCNVAHVIALRGKFTEETVEFFKNNTSLLLEKDISGKTVIDIIKKENKSVYKEIAIFMKNKDSISSSKNNANSL